MRIFKDKIILIIDSKQIPAVVSGSARSMYVKDTTIGKRIVIKGAADQIPRLYNEALRRHLITGDECIRYKLELLRDLKKYRKGAKEKT